MLTRTIVAPAPAAALMTILAAKTDPQVAKDINITEAEVKDDLKKLLSYVSVDYGTTSRSKKEVQRMMGTKLSDGSLSGTIPSMMRKVGLKLKTIVSSHSQD